MKRSFALFLILAAGALSLVAAGCGGDDGGGGGDRLSQADFVSQANAICKEANDKIEALDAPDFDPTSDTATDEQLDEFGDFLDDVIPIARDEVDELRDLNPPENVESDFNQALSLVDETLNEGEEAAEAAHDGDREKVKEKLEESNKHSNEADELAKKIGIPTCAE